MKNNKNAIKIMIAIIVVLLLVFTQYLDFGERSVYATEENEIVTDDITFEVVKGIFVTLSINMSGNNGVITATAKHDFSLFSSTVPVYVYLYSSYSYQQSYEDMTLVGSNYISDLDMGDSITVSASTGGIQKYWKARMYFKIDSGSWQEKTTNTFLYDANGNEVT